MKTAVQRSAFSGVSVSAVLTAWITGIGLNTAWSGYLMETDKNGEKCGSQKVQEARDRRAVSVITEAEYSLGSFGMKAQRSWLVVARLAVSSSWPGWVKVKWSTNARVITTAVVPLSKDLLCRCFFQVAVILGRYQVWALNRADAPRILWVSGLHRLLIEINKKESLHVRSVSLLQIKQASWIHKGLAWSGSA